MGLAGMVALVTGPEAIINLTSGAAFRSSNTGRIESAFCK